MADEPQSVCPKCGQDVPSPRKTSNQSEDPREYDHRCILMPRRTQVGGIITPQ